MSWVNKFALGKIFLKENLGTGAVTVDYKKESGLPVWSGIQVLHIPTCVNAGGGTADVYLSHVQNPDGTITLNTLGGSTISAMRNATVRNSPSSIFGDSYIKDSTVLLFINFEIVSSVGANLSYSEAKPRLSVQGGVTVHANGGVLCNVYCSRDTSGYTTITGNNILSSAAGAMKDTYNKYWAVNTYICVSLPKYTSYTEGLTVHYTTSSGVGTVKVLGIDILINANRDYGRLHHSYQKQLMLLEKI